MGCQPSEPCVDVTRTFAAGARYRHDAVMAEWVCQQCTFSNQPLQAQCEMCGQTPPAAGFWACAACTFAENAGRECEMCGTPRAEGASPPPADAAGTDHAAELRQMGFDDARVKAALEATGGALEASVQWLFDQDEGDELRHKQKQLPAPRASAAPPPAPPAAVYRSLAVPAVAAGSAAASGAAVAAAAASGSAASGVAARSAGGAAAKEKEPPQQQRPRPASATASTKAPPQQRPASAPSSSSSRASSRLMIELGRLQKIDKWRGMLQSDRLEAVLVAPQLTALASCGGQPRLLAAPRTRLRPLSRVGGSGPMGGCGEAVGGQPKPPNPNPNPPSTLTLTRP